jgi:hypothetical protein
MTSKRELERTRMYKGFLEPARLMRCGFIKGVYHVREHEREDIERYKKVVMAEWYERINCLNCGYNTGIVKHVGTAFLHGINSPDENCMERDEEDCVECAALVRLHNGIPCHVPVRCIKTTWIEGCYPIQKAMNDE